MKYMNQNIRKLLFHILIPAVLSMLLLPMTAMTAISSCSVSVHVTIQVTGSSIPSGATYRVALERITPDAPMPEQSIITREGAGGLSFGSMTYMNTGDYLYRIRQNSESRRYFTFDETVYTLTVRISNTADGGLGSEVWAVIGDGETKVDEVIFTNQYRYTGGGSIGGSSGGGNTSGGPGVIDGDDLPTMDDGATPLPSPIPDNTILLAILPKTGDTTMAALWMILITASGAGVLMLMYQRIRNSKKN